MKYPFIILMNSHLIPKMINNEGLPSGSPFYLRYSRKPHPTLVPADLLRIPFSFFPGKLCLQTAYDHGGCCGRRQLKQDMDMVRLPVELCQISPETLLYQIFRMNLKKVHDPGTDDLPPVFDYKNGMVCKTAYRVCPPAINSFLF